jgi:hypothetical protein
MDSISLGSGVPLALALAAGAAQAQTFAVGDDVEISASGRWVPCVVSDNDPAAPIMRVRCSAYPALSRAAGVYIVEKNPREVRPAGAGNAQPAAAATPRPGPAAAGPRPGGVLKAGEYACYGSGGRAMIGLGFKVLAGGRYTDLEGRNPGSYSIAGDTVTFRGGHLGGQVGRGLKGDGFQLGLQASCEPY